MAPQPGLHYWVAVLMIIHEFFNFFSAKNVVLAGIKVRLEALGSSDDVDTKIDFKNCSLALSQCRLYSSGKLLCLE